MKKQFLKSVLLAIAGVGLVAEGAVGTPVFGDGGVSLQQALDGITVDGSSSTNAATDMLDDSVDSYWSFTASGGSVTNLVFELSDFLNSTSFGIFDATNPTHQVQIFSGSANSGTQTVVSINDAGNVFINSVPTGDNFASDNFGYYLLSPQGTFYSDTDLNPDGLDHMAAYQGVGDTVQLPVWPPGTWTSSEFILAWEDLNGGGDRDYNDFVVMVSTVEPFLVPIPEPAAMLLFGTGLVGLAGAVRKRKS